jgi:hypothetical protein
MSKSRRYWVALALLITTVVVIQVSLPLRTLRAATASCMGTSIFISVKDKMVKLTNPDVENLLLDQESVAKGPLLRIVQIRITSASGLKQLRAMHLDILSVRPDPDCPPGGELLSGEYIVEAVVTKGELVKLKAMGFEVSVVSEKN